MKLIEIKLDRIRLGKTQGDMARDLGITQAVYGFKERGMTKFTMPERAKLAEILGYTEEEAKEKIFDDILIFLPQG